MNRSIEARIKKRILKHGRGWCFTLIHFLDLGNHASVRKALSNLQQQKFIRRLAHGIYDFPRTDELLGEIPPSLDAVARAIAIKNGVKIQPSGAHAANLLGFTTQVPGRTIYLINGSSRKVKIGNQEIIFKKTAPKVMASAGTREGLLIQGMKNMGKEHMDPVIQTRIARFLNGSNEKEIRENMKFAPAWIRSLVFEIKGFGYKKRKNLRNADYFWREDSGL